MPAKIGDAENRQDTEDILKNLNLPGYKPKKKGLSRWRRIIAFAADLLIIDIFILGFFDNDSTPCVQSRTMCVRH